MTRDARPAIVSAVTTAAFCAGCIPSEPNRLSELRTLTITINGQQFQLWVAESIDERAKGLMYITEEEMAPLPNGTEHGMLFVFDHSVRDSFWMKNTIIPLDIAYLSADGKVINTYTMAPLDDRHNQYTPDAPYRYALEVKAHRLGELGVKTGDKLDIPASMLKGTS